MRGQTPILTITHTAAADVKAQQFVTFQGKPAQETDTKVTAILGVAQADAKAGSDVAVATIGMLLVKAGAAISKGDKVVSDEDGYATPSTTDVFGIALHDAVIGSTVQILVR